MSTQPVRFCIHLTDNDSAWGSVAGGFILLLPYCITCSGGAIRDHSLELSVIAVIRMHPIDNGNAPILWAAAGALCYCCLIACVLAVQSVVAVSDSLPRGVASVQVGPAFGLVMVVLWWIFLR